MLLGVQNFKELELSGVQNLKKMKPEVNNMSFDMANIRDTLELAEIKAAESRAAITKARGAVVVNCGKQRRKCSTDHQYVPPKQLLQYLVRCRFIIFPFFTFPSFHLSPFLPFHLSTFPPFRLFAFLFFSF